MRCQRDQSGEPRVVEGVSKRILLYRKVLQDEQYRCGSRSSRWVSRSLHGSRWLGYRVFLVDGSSFSMPDNPPQLQEHFGQPGNQMPGCGFPVAHWLAMMHYGTGMVVRMLTAPLEATRIARRGTPPGTPARRCARRRPRVLFLRPFGPAFSAESAWRVSRAPTDDREFPAASETRAVASRQERLPEERSTPFAVSSVVGNMRPTGEMVQTGPMSSVAR